MFRHPCDENRRRWIFGNQLVLTKYKITKHKFIKNG